MSKPAKSPKKEAVETLSVERRTPEAARPDPFASWLSPLRWPLGRLFDEGWSAPLLERGDRLLAPSTDVHENDDRLVVTVELPGLTKEDVKVQVEDNVLTVSGEKRSETKETGAECVRMERRYGAFHRSLTLPPSVDPDAVKAHIEHGVLTIDVPKREAAKPKSIRID